MSGGHLFVQLPLHPSHPALSSLQFRMNQCYNHTTAPELPESIDSAICALCVQENWYRVQIVSHDSQTKTSLVKYVDFGGFLNVSTSELRQIHADFMSVPFQAIECVMSNIRPQNNGEWSKEATDTIQSFTQNAISQAQIAGYTQEGLPEIYLFASITKDVSFISNNLNNPRFLSTKKLYFFFRFPFRVYCSSIKNYALATWLNGLNLIKKDNQRDAIRLM